MLHLRWSGNTAKQEALNVQRKRRQILREGGEFEPFKMLIGAVFALLVLTIIVSAIQSFEQFRTKISIEKFYSGLQNATNQPNGQLLVIDNVFFEVDTIFAANSIARNIGLKEGCLELDASRPAFENPSRQLVKMLSNAETSVFARCRTNESGGNPACEVSCCVSFGEQSCA
ncbi:MAG: hypothetical protein HYW50_01000 [Candidatus Diapherotrites archaeon]|nr:hypothetical protein [Candidatus Diapherotrites archaeon]